MHNIVFVKHRYKLVLFLLSTESRCDKDMDALSGYAICLPNLTRLHFVEHRPIFCVEIKVSLSSIGEAFRNSKITKQT